ncbi:MAG: metallophosphoesterase [Myxococcota bacterium]
MIRIAHATDIHWFAAPRLAQLTGKRIFGTANLYLRGRRRAFDEGVQAELVAHLLAQRPDLVFITGDLTAQALPEEFAKARRALEPLLAEVPTLILPGNHDLYTADAERDQTFHRTFAPWAGRAEPRGLIRARVGRIRVLGLDPNRPLWVRSSGKIPPDQLEDLASELADPAGDPVVLGLHYPPVDRHGARYDGAGHGLVNAAELIDVLERAVVRPLFVAVGHVHHGFRSAIRLSDGSEIPVFDCGSSGHAHQPALHRAAATATYSITDDGEVRCDRWIHDGERFAPEPGGAFTSGG